MLDQIESLLDRVKVLYEQYFLGIQKQAPAHLHHDLDRKLRDLSQIQIRNTAMRYRLATVQQKFGSYNTYWRRTLRQIENGTYARNLSRIGRQAVRTGEEIPEEILAAMPKRMREQVARDREAALAQQRRRGAAGVAGGSGAMAAAGGATGEGVVSEDFDLDIEEAALDDVATIHSRPPPMVHQIEEDDVDVDALFAAITDTEAPAVVESKPPSKRPGTDVGFGESSGTRPRPQAPQPARPAAAHTGAGMRPGPATAGTMFSAGTTVVAGAAGSGSMPAHAPAPAPAPSRAPVVAAPPIAAAPIAAAPIAAPPPSSPAISPSMGEPIARITPKKITTQPMTAVRPGRPSAAEPPAAAPKPTTQPMGSARPARPPIEPPAPAPAATPSSSTPALPKAPTTQPMQSPPPPRPVAGRPAAPPPAPPPARPSTARLPVQAPPAAASSSSSSPAAGAPRPAGGSVTPPRVRPPSGVPPLASHAPRAADPLKPIAPPASASPPRPPPIPSIPRPPIPPAPRAAAPPASSPPAGPAGRSLPPGVSQADVSALYDQYVKARSSVGEQSDARTYDRLMRTIEQQAPKIMQEHQAKGVEFQVVVKDNQVVLKAKPKP